MYISKTPILSCILHSLNNYLGYDRYTENTADNTNTVDYFYRIFPDIDPKSILLTIQPEYFHLFLQHRWLDIFVCNNLFVVKNKHIYLVKKQNTSWIKIDYLHVKEFTDKYVLHSHIVNSTIIILVIHKDIFDKNKNILRAWQPSNDFYKLFKDKIAETIK